MTSPSSQLDNLFDPALVAAQQPNWPGGKDGAPLAKAVTMQDVARKISTTTTATEDKSYKWIKSGDKQTSIFFIL